jgi:hypothetical protein
MPQMVANLQNILLQTTQKGTRVARSIAKMLKIPDILHMNQLFVSGPYTKEVTGPPSLLGDTSGASGTCGACLPHSFLNIAFRGQQINITSYTLDCRNFYILKLASKYGFL